MLGLLFFFFYTPSGYTTVFIIKVSRWVKQVFFYISTLLSFPLQTQPLILAFQYHRAVTESRRKENGEDLGAIKSVPHP